MSKKSNTKQVAIVEHVEPTTSVEVKKVDPIPFKYDDLLKDHTTKSAVIRFLDSKGYDRSTIAKFMGIKYQFVRNVLITPINKATA